MERTTLQEGDSTDDQTTTNYDWLNNQTQHGGPHTDYATARELGGIGSPVVGVDGNYANHIADTQPTSDLTHILPDGMDAYETQDEVVVTHKGDAWKGCEEDILADIPDAYKTNSILSDDDIYRAVPAMDDPLAPSIPRVRGALNAVQHHACANSLYSAEDENVVYEDDTCYVQRDGNHEGLTNLLDDAGIDDGDLREAVKLCHTAAAKQVCDHKWDVTYPLVIVKTRW